MRHIALLILVLLAACSVSPIPTPIPTSPQASRAPSTTPVPLSPTPLPPSPTPLPRYDLVLTNATLIDGTGAPPMPNAAVAILGDRIVAVGRAAELIFSPDTPRHDLNGASILPGFINAHAHTSGLSDEDLRAWTRAGITTVRDLGGSPAEVIARRDRIAAGADPSLPRLVVAGPLVTVDNSFSTQIYGPGDQLLLVHGPEDARVKISALLDEGVDLIKIAVSGRTDIRADELSDEEVAAICATAAERGVRVVAHVDRAVALRRAVLNGIGEAVHSPRDRIPDDLIQLMVERGVGLVPTIDVYESLAEGRGAAAEWRRSTMPVMYDNLRRFVAAGGNLALGDDYGGAPNMLPGMPIAEIEHWAAAGIDPMTIIVAASAGGTRATGLESVVGTVEPGMVADILVVDGNPLTDINALTRPLLVLHNGQPVTGSPLP